MLWRILYTDYTLIKWEEGGGRGGERVGRGGEAGGPCAKYPHNLCLSHTRLPVFSVHLQWVLGTGPGLGINEALLRT